MAEMYRARDTRLKREVALKILPVSCASDPEGWRDSAKWKAVFVNEQDTFLLNWSSDAKGEFLRERRVSAALAPGRKGVAVAASHALRQWLASARK